MTLFAAAALWFGAAAAHAAEIKWETDYGRARERCIAEDKLLFIDFYADW
jgi:hypothetical protein